MVAPQHSATWLRAATIAAALAIGCAERPAPSAELDADTPSEGGGATVTFELGKGQFTFEPLTDGEELPIFAGPQGGHHVYVSMRVRGIGPERVVVRSTTAIGADPDLVLEWGSRVTFRAESSSDAGGSLDAAIDQHAYHVYTGWPAQLIDAPEHVGERARVEMKLEDARGHRASDARTVVIGPLMAP